MNTSNPFILLQTYLSAFQKLGYGVWLAPIFIGSIFVTSTVGLAILGILIWAPVLLAVMTKKKFSIKYLCTIEVGLFLLFLAYASLSLLWSPFDRPVLLTKEFVRISTCLGFVLYFSLLVETTHFGEIERYIKTLIKFSFMLGACYLIYVNHLVVEIWRSSTLHELQGLIATPGLFFHHSPIAWLFAMVIIIVITGRFGSGYYQRAIELFLLIISLFVLVIAQSRGAYLGLLIGVIAYGLLGAGKESKKYIIGACLIALGFFLLYAYAEIPIISTLVERGASDRVEIWKYAVEVARDNLFFGFGFGAPSIFKTDLIYIMHFHSGIFSTLYYGGVVGVFFLVLLVASVLLRNITKSENRVWMSIFMMSLTIFVFDGDHLFNYFSAEFYMFVLPILIMMGNKVWKEGMSHAKK